MAMRDAQDNFNIIASAEALSVLAEDEYFQELPINWQNIIRKIQAKLVPKEHSARLSEQLKNLAERSPAHNDARATLPDAIKHLIAALHNDSVPGSADLKLEFGRSYTPYALNTKMARSQPVEDRAEECPDRGFRHRAMPGLVN